MASKVQNTHFFENFSNYFKTFDKRRVKFLYLVVQSLSIVQNVNLVKVTCALKTDAKASSNYRRIQRFIHQVRFDKIMLAKFLITLSGLKGPYTILVDRTNWQFGQSKINYLMFSIKGEKWSIPIMWSLLPKKGNSSEEERIELMNELLKVIPSDQIYNLVADREFIGKKWFKYLIDKGIFFDIRIRANFLTIYRNKKIRVSKLFSRLKMGEKRTLKKFMKIGDSYVGLQGCKIENSKNHQEEYLIIATYTEQEGAIERYSERWYIENMFKDLKSNGFQLRNTHITKLERLNTLMCIIAITYTWMIRIGNWVHKKYPTQIKKKKHGRYSKSIFRLGLDSFSYEVYHRNVRSLSRFIRFLSCT